MFSLSSSPNTKDFPGSLSVFVFYLCRLKWFIILSISVLSALQLSCYSAELKRKCVVAPLRHGVDANPQLHTDAQTHDLPTGQSSSHALLQMVIASFLWRIPACSVFPSVKVFLPAISEIQDLTRTFRPAERETA